MNFIRTTGLAMCIAVVGFIVYQYADQKPDPALILRGGNPDSVSMTLKSSVSTISVGQSFTVDVILDTGTQRVSAADIIVTFPTNLQATSIVPGSFLPVGLISGTTAPGQAKIAVGSQIQTAPAPQGAQGIGTIAKLTLTASQTGVAQIQIATSTQVAAIGQAANVLTVRNPVSITVTSVTTTTPTPVPTSTTSSTPTVTVSSTPSPSTTVSPATTPIPTTTPVPTATSTHTSTPVPTSRPTPTRTPIPSPTPKPTPLSVLPYGSSWKYLDNGSDQGIAWQGISFNDTKWSTGHGQFGYGDGDEKTVVQYGPDSHKKYVTTYFRKKFTVTSPSVFKEFMLKILKDDGAVVYINGIRVAKINIPNTFTYMTLAGTGKENSVTSHSINPSVFHAGINTIAVEVHQVSRSNNDMSFDLSLEGRY